MSLDRIFHLLRASRARRLSAEFSVWQLRTPWLPQLRSGQRRSRGRAQIISECTSMATPCFLATRANPQEFDVGGPWSHAAEDTWPIPPGCDLERLLRCLAGVGRWHIYCAAVTIPPCELPDTFASSARDVAEFALGHAVPVLIHSSPKNRRWRLWVEPVEGRGELAA